MSEPQIPEQNWIIDCHRAHAEVLDLEKNTVWQSRRPMGKDSWAALELPAGCLKVGIGIGTMDGHYFRRSPGADDDGPVAEREFGGHPFIHCANPPPHGPEFPVGDDPKLMRVDKYHSLIFEAGTEVDVLLLPDGQEFVQVIAASPTGGGLLQPESLTGEGHELPLPEGWVLRTEKIDARATIHLPHPTQAWFFANGASFQGPIETFSGA